MTAPRYRGTYEFRRGGFGLLLRLPFLEREYEFRRLVLGYPASGRPCCGPKRAGWAAPAGPGTRGASRSSRSVKRGAEALNLVGGRAGTGGEARGGRVEGPGKRVKSGETGSRVQSGETGVDMGAGTLAGGRAPGGLFGAGLSAGLSLKRCVPVASGYSATREPGETFLGSRSTAAALDESEEVSSVSICRRPGAGTLKVPRAGTGTMGLLDDWWTGLRDESSDARSSSASSRYLCLAAAERLRTSYFPRISASCARASLRSARTRTVSSRSWTSCILRRATCASRSSEVSWAARSCARDEASDSESDSRSFVIVSAGGDSFSIASGVV
ncbi:hypothetical protein B0H17DRAFT_1051084 [Mycena rosella]|uniref:Uncharacterized protein n=1 Tax=Mycena rosella TaxID=1033263 RepID=A0AAD7DRI9_MYCRO|nr:hypothetical protein B0H17DRAFT_1051084 [Mycena rosella]